MTLAVDATLKRCPWPKDDALYLAYHDEEWGVPEYDDRALYEKLVLDGFQAGLSWITILRKRENFRRAFDGFVPEKIARYTPKKIERLMQDAGIVRNRAKIEGTAPAAGESVMAGDRQVGTMGSAAAGHGLALLRLDRVADALSRGEELVAGGVVIRPLKPEWARFAFPDGAKAAE